MRQVIRDNIGMILAAHMVMLTAPVLVHAEGNHNFINFTEPLKTERGELAPIGPDASYLSDADACAIATREWGWAGCTTLDKIAVDIGPGVGTILLRKPVSDGYVKLDDFVGDSARAEIDQIARDLKESLAAQSKQTGRKIEFTGWRLYPTADRQRNLIYYALDMSWDGDPQTAIRVMLLDRYGFIEMEVLPSADNLGAQQIAAVIDTVISAYTPKAQASYSNFQSGDKVAAYGGLGVLATVLGVKYGKAASAGLLAVVLILLKKAWFIVLLPFVALGGLFKRLFGRKAGA
jgi:hypothetical protein